MATKLKNFAYHPKIDGENIILSYKGPMNNLILAQIGDTIQAEFRNNPRLSYKIFSIYIELAQNMLFYSEEKNYFSGKSPVGIILISEASEGYTLASGNLIRSKEVKYLSEKCKYINSLDNKSLRKYKRELRNLPSAQGSKGRAGIGLVQSALLSENPLQFEIEKINDDYSFFTLCTKIVK